MSDEIEAAAALMVRDYIVFAFLVCLGALQISVSISGMRGLWLLPNRAFTRALGILLIVIGLAFYIFSPMWVEGPWSAGSVIDGTSENRIWGTAALDEISAARNLNDIHGGMAGTAYASFFILSAVLATLFAAVIGTINTRLFPSPSRSERNVDTSSPISKGRYRGVSQEVHEPNEGLDVLKHSDAISTLSSSLRNFRKTGKADIRNYLQSAHSWSIPALIGRIQRN